VRAVLPDLEKLGARLAEGPVPLALDHNDLHDNNTFVPSESETTLRFFDFGDALWAHPFSSMLIVVNVVTDPDELNLSEAGLGRLLDAYLSAWTDLAPLPELRRLLDAALVLGRVHRYLSWDHCLADVPTEALGEHAGSPAMWLGLLADCLEPGGSPRVL
jgi:Ser/Thr protein kinase RdoA (MazF antagonist)